MAFEWEGDVWACRPPIDRMEVDSFLCKGIYYKGIVSFRLLAKIEQIEQSHNNKKRRPKSLTFSSNEKQIVHKLESAASETDRIS